MRFSKHFICAGEEYSTLSSFVPAPYIRKKFKVEKAAQKSELLICGLGFYELYINGRRITKGALAPYISNPDDLVYYDSYDLSGILARGDNVIAICLGNGFQNNPGGYVWDFDKARWRGAPKVAFSLSVTFDDGGELYIESDESCRTAPSPIYFDDYRNGEYYDARNEIAGWAEAGFDDSGWDFAKSAPDPLGESVLCAAEPITVSEERSPVLITAQEDGYLYDFGLNDAGVCRLCIDGERGQEIALYYAEHLVDGRLYRRNICFDENDYVQKDIYICKGQKGESYVPSFTYHGFRYVFVKGLKPEQATPGALTYLVMHSALRERGGFTSSDKTLNTLQEMTRRSTLSNFYYFPTDCPQREKNGWTGDAALSAEHTLLNLEAEHSYAEWLRNIRKAQAWNGALPGIIPTGGWGFHWGNGPAWDWVLVNLPYYVYLYRGDKNILLDNADAIYRYLSYLKTKLRPDGLACFGLGDWCPVGRAAHDCKAPLEMTDSIVAMDICAKAAYIFGQLDMTERQSFAKELQQSLRRSIREHLIDIGSMTAAGSCQTSQAMAIFFDVFEPDEKAAAFKVLTDIIARDGNVLDTGILGGRVIFHVLSEFGESELAYEMITADRFPSYAYWIKQGATTLWELFTLDKNHIGSLNHHFWGDISGWFISRVAGIRYNPDRCGQKCDITPSFLKKLDFAEAFHIAPEGRVFVRWDRTDGGVALKILMPTALKGDILLPKGYVFTDGTNNKPCVSGEYKVLCAN